MLSRNGSNLKSCLRWRRAEKRRQFRAGSGPRGGLGEVLGRANWAESPSSARAKNAEWLSTAGSDAASAIKRVRRGVDVGRKRRGLGRRRPFQPRPRCSPQLGTRRWPGAAQGRTFRTSALENEGRGLGRRSEGSAARGNPEGELGSPSRLTACRRNVARKRHSRGRGLARDYSLGLSFMR